MSDSVKFIFTTLIKVPCIIFGAFFIFNIFAFFFIYFKILGFSYVVMQEVVENNYLTSSQIDQLNAQFSAIDNIPLADNTNIIVGLSSSATDSFGNKIPVMINKNRGNGRNTLVHTNSPNGSTTSVVGKSASSKTQYGTTKTVGVHCDYTIVWPLSYNNAMTSTGTDGTGVSGLGASHKYNSMDTTYNGDVYENNMGSGDVTQRGFKVTIPLDIYYTVPGLKYYADET